MSHRLIFASKTTLMYILKIPPCPRKQMQMYNNLYYYTLLLERAKLSASGYDELIIKSIRYHVLTKA